VTRSKSIRWIDPLPFNPEVIRIADMILAFLWPVPGYGRQEEASLRDSWEERKGDTFRRWQLDLEKQSMEASRWRNQR
jgi:hypothetical protein